MVWDLSLGPKPMDYSRLPIDGRKTPVAAEPLRRRDTSKYVIPGVVQRALDFKRNRSSSQTGGTASRAFERARARSEQRQAAKSNTRPMVEEAPHAELGQGPTVGPPLPEAPKPRFVRRRHLSLVPQRNAAEEDKEHTVGAVERAQVAKATDGRTTLRTTTASTSSSSASAAP
eukprot:TRINITY_DN9665_c0_g5_i1.p1 TRINITY_DN9665_c0_g5~~TRINITY_DN9665_c0_g5_i1.p1  ORF type:complete len:173 (-),score=17.10 TRINITY_DN9665_c0_g5_i1:746-1264(-)